VKAVPRWILGLLALSLAAQIAWQLLRGTPTSSSTQLAPAPGAQALRLASFGESEAAARLSMLYLQSFELQAVDYGRMLGWLDAVLELDPHSQYPLFLAARVLAENPNPARSRMVLQFVYEAFLDDPGRRWPWLAHAALLAKHRLKDLELARRYAQALERWTNSRDVPLWARQMEIFILEDMNELEAAKIMLGGLIESGAVTDPAELRFLKQRLEELEKR
jgi:hypothetical protein